MPTPILTTKLYAPLPRADTVARPQLLHRLGQGLSQGRRLTLVSAPAGFGKTTLVSQWLTERMKDEGGGMKPGSAANASPSSFIPHPSSFAWLSLDEEDNDPARFQSYLVAALQTVDAGLGQALQALAATPPPLATAVTLLVNDLAAITTPLVLVLDDYHAIAAEVIHRAVQHLIDHRPPTLHLALVTRADPPLPLARWRVRGEITEVRASDLRFSLPEAERFLTGTMGLAIGPEAVSVLEQRTEGWVAGLQLAALSLQGSDAAHIASFVTTFGGSHRYVIDYLLDEVMQRQPEHLRAFLYQTAILDRLCAPLCDAVLGLEPEPMHAGSEPGYAQLILERLERMNLFLVPLDGHRAWYRYHHLFADFLRVALRQEPAHTAALHRRAARWFERQGMLSEAIRHAIAAGDGEHAAAIVEREGTSAWARADLNLFALIGKLPRDLVARRPWLCIFHAWSLQLTGQIQAVEPYFQDAEAHLDTLSSPRDIRALRSYIATTRALILELRGTASTLPAEVAEGIAEIPEQLIAMRYGACWAAGFVAYLSGDFAAATRLFMEPVRHGEASGITGVIPICLAKLGAMGLVTGALQATAQLMRTYLPLVGRGETHGLWLGGFINLVLGQVALERNELRDAAGQVETGLHDLERWGVPYAIALGEAIRAQLCGAQGDAAAAEAALGRAEQIACAVHLHPDIASMIRSLRVRRLLAAGEVDGAARLLVPFQPATPGQDGFRRELDQITLARVWLAQGRLPEADALLAALTDTARAAGRLLRLAQCLVLQALTLEARGDAAGALTALAQAVELAAPEGFVRVFLDEGPRLGALLARLNAQGLGGSGQTQAFLNTLRTALGPTPADAQAQAQAAPSPPRPMPDGQAADGLLSEQELSVLRLLAEGLSNQAIAERLIIGLGTAKWHVHNLFGKLEVTSRTQAVARARELGLI
ncbi:MAG: AAA family ATPase [Chloroflexales bacterium]|nr:AAA family ATPase [Chloroflexales bacterium]